jgi:hypothetical protein
MGRTKSALNYRSREAREFALEILESAEYRASLQRRAADGTLGSMETTLWYFAFGRPKEHIELSVAAEDLSQLTNQELIERTTRILEELRELTLPVLCTGPVPLRLVQSSAPPIEDVDTPTSEGESRSE